MKTILSILGLAIGIFAVPPEAWMDTLMNWQKALLFLAHPLVIIVCSALLAISVYKKFSVRIVSEEDYSKEFRILLNSGKYSVVKIFGYTGEVVTNDLLKYKDRYNKDVEIKLLLRNWLVEETDENEHNNNRKRDNTRPWVKSVAIRAMAFKRWEEQPLQIKIRYYDHQPILKGVLFFDKEGNPITAFVNFQKWVPMPPEGGSVFKSVPSTM